MPTWKQCNFLCLAFLGIRLLRQTNLYQDWTSNCFQISKNEYSNFTWALKNCVSCMNVSWRHLLPLFRFAEQVLLEYLEAVYGLIKAPPRPPKDAIPRGISNKRILTNHWFDSHHGQKRNDKIFFGGKEGWCPERSLNKQTNNFK